MSQAGVKGMSERSELIPCNILYYNIAINKHQIKYYSGELIRCVYVHVCL